MLTFHQWNAFQKLNNILEELVDTWACTAPTALRVGPVGPLSRERPTAGVSAREAHALDDDAEELVGINVLHLDRSPVSPIRESGCSSHAVEGLFFNEWC